MAQAKSLRDRARAGGLRFEAYLPPSLELLMVLERPEIPLHTNGSENDIRCADAVDCGPRYSSPTSTLSPSQA